MSENLNITITSQLASNFAATFTSASTQVHGLRDEIIGLRKQQSLIKRFEMNMTSANKAKQRLSELKQNVKQLDYEIKRDRKLGLSTTTAEKSIQTLANRAKKLETRVASANTKLINAKSALNNAGISARNASSHYQTLDSEIKKLDHSYSALKANASQKLAISQGFEELQTSAIGTAASIMSVGYAIKKMTDSSNELSALNSAYKAIFSTTENGAKQMNFVRESAQKLGVDFVSLAGSYKNWAASAEESSIKGKVQQEIFLAVAGASKVLGLSTDNTKGTFLALTQMMNKGKVSADEITGQLGEHLPNALGHAADAMGVTKSEFLKLMEKGEIMADQLLPRLANELNKKYGAGLSEASQSLASDTERLKNKINEISVTFGQALTPAVHSATNTLTGLLTGVNDFASAHPHVITAAAAIAVGLIALSTAALLAKGSLLLLRSSGVSATASLIKLTPITNAATVALNRLGGAAVVNHIKSTSVAVGGLIVRLGAISGISSVAAASLALITGPIGLIVAGIAAVGIGLYAMRDTMITVSGQSDTMGHYIASTWNVVSERIANFTGLSLSNISASFRQHYKNITLIASVAYGMIKSEINRLYQKVADHKAWQIMGQGIASVATLARNYVNAMIGTYVGGYRAILAAWNNLPASFELLIVSAANAAISKLSMFVTTAGSLLNHILPDSMEIDLSGIQIPLIKISKDAKSTGQAIKTAFQSGFKTDYVGDFGKVASKVVGDVSHYFSDLKKEIVLDAQMNRASAGFDKLSIAMDNKAFANIDSDFKKIKQSSGNVLEEISKQPPVLASAADETKKLSEAQKAAEKTAKAHAKAQENARKATEKAAENLKFAQDSIGKTDEQIRAMALSLKKGYTPEMANAQAAAEAKTKSLVVLRKAHKATKESIEKATKALKFAEDSIGKTDEQIRAMALSLKKGYTPEMANAQAAAEAKTKSLVVLRKAHKATKESIEKATKALKFAEDSIGKTDEEIRAMTLSLKKGYTPEMANAQAAAEAKTKSLVVLRKAHKATKESIEKATKALKFAEDSIGKTDEQIRAMALSLKKGYTPEMANAQAAAEAKTKSLVVLRKAHEATKESIEKATKALKFAEDSIGKTDEEIRAMTLSLKKGYTPEMANAQAANEAKTKSLNTMREGINTSSDALKIATALAQDGKEAAEAIALKNKGWSDSEIVKKQAIDKATNAMNAQAETTKKLDGIINDLLHGKIESFEQLGDAIIGAFDNGRLDASLSNLSKKIGRVLKTGNTKGLGGSILNVFEVDKNLSGFGQMAQSYGTGSSLAGMAGANKTGQLAAGVGSAIGMAVGGPIGSAIGSALGGLVGNFFGGKRPVRGTFGGNEAVGSGWYGTKRNNTGKSFSYSGAFGAFGVRGGSRKITSSLGRYKDGQIEGVMQMLASLKTIDTEIASFLPKSVISNVKNKLKTFEISTLNTQDVAKARIKAIFSAMPYELSKLIDVNLPIEKLVARIQAIKVVSNTLTPALQKMGLNLGNTQAQILTTAVALSDSGGGVDTFRQQIAFLSSNFTSATTKSKAAAEGLIADLASLNYGLGLSGNALITNKTQLMEQIQGLDLKTQTDQKAFASTMKYQESLLIISNTVETLTPAFSNLSLNLGNTSTVVTETIIKLAGMAGGVEKLQTGLNSYYQNFYSQEEQKAISLAQSALSVQKYIEGLTTAQQAQLEQKGIRAFVEGLDLKKQAEKEAFISSLAVSESFKKVSDSGKSMSSILLSAPKGMVDFADSMKTGADKTANALGGLKSAIGDLANSAINATRAALAAANSAQVAASNASIAANSAASAANDASYANNNASKINGSHFSGVFNIPHDNYRANLHQSEMVLPAYLARPLRAGEPIQLKDPSSKISSIKSVKYSKANQRATDLLNTHNSNINTVSNKNADHSNITINAPITINVPEGMDAHVVGEMVQQALEQARFDAERENRGMMNDGRLSA